jgi:5-methylcytosine-specific restriction enzyme subunit McrC
MTEIVLTEHKRYNNLFLNISDIAFLKENHSKHISISDGKDFYIKTSSYVGFIKLPSGQALRINPKIEVKNLLYMIAYAYDLKSLSLDYIDKKQPISVNTPIELYVIVLINWVEKLIKKGIYKSYIQKEEYTSTPKGKILAYESQFCFNKMYCAYENLTYQNIENKIIKSTLILILTKHNINTDLKIRLRKLLFKLSEIETIIISRNVFRNVKYNSFNSFYKPIIDLCETLYSGILLTDLKGAKSFSGFIVNMNSLFEKFILKLLQHNFPYETIKSYNSDSWISPYSESDKNIVPEIRTDILIKDKLVIEAKYFRDALNEYGKLRNEHIYQLSTYMVSENVNGVLVYPKMECADNQWLSVKNTNLHIRILSLSLDSNAKNFESSLNSFLEKIKKSFHNKS